MANEKQERGSVLVVEDDPDASANLRDILDLDGWSVEHASTAKEALHERDWSSIAVIIVDWKLPDGTAETLLPRFRELAPASDVIVATGAVSLSGAVVALRHGAADYIVKPIDAAALRGSMARIAERQRLALEKARSERAFQNLVEAAASAIVILRADRRITYFNAFAETLTGYKRSEVVGKLFGVLLSESDIPVAIEFVASVLRHEEPRGCELPICGKDGSSRHMVWNATSLPDDKGETSVLLVGQDITTLKEAQNRALQSERLAAIGEAMAGLVHESRNALQRSQACLEMLERQVRDRPNCLDLIARIQRAQDHLHQLYENVREYAAPIQLRKSPLDLSRIVAEVWDDLAAARVNRAARLREENAHSDLVCSVDGMWIHQVFRNLFENALQACADPVEITVAWTETSIAGKPAVRCSVRDNGPGFSSESAKRAFDPFFTTKTRGTGLGMPIAKRIIEAHGGAIAVENGSPGGAVIVLALPKEAP